MSLVVQEHAFGTPYLERIMQAQSLSAASCIRPAENCWHMVFARHRGRLRSIMVGPWTRAGVASWGADAEVVWVKFRLGAFMPHLPVREFLDSETTLPEASHRAFWLNGSAVEVPDFEHADVFVDRLARREWLVRDPLVNDALLGNPVGVASRTLRHRFLQATGLGRNRVSQLERAQRAVALLERGVSIPDAVFEAGYADQPHLTRSLRRFIGRTPAQIAREPDNLAISFKTRAARPG